MRFLWINLFFLLIPHFLPGQNSKTNIPKYIGLVNDFSGVLSKAEIDILEKKLRTYEDSTSNQIVICIEKSLNGQDQYDRSMAIANNWLIGQKEKNNGILIYLSIEEKKLSFRTGSGTQGALTDGETGTIRRQLMLPYLRNQQYFLALDTGTSAVIQALAGEFKADGKKKKKNKAGGLISIIAILGFFILASLFQRRGGQRGFSSAGPIWWGGGFGGGGFGGGSGGSGWGGMGGGGGFNGGGSDGGW